MTALRNAVESTFKAAGELAMREAQQCRRLIIVLTATFVMLGCGGTAQQRETGSLGAACYPNDTCNEPFVCEDGLCVEPADDPFEGYGGEGEPCYPEAWCDEPFICESGTCVSPPEPGGRGEECYPNDTCDSPLVCIEGTCVEPASERPRQRGGEGEPCHPDFSCNEPLVCEDGVCVSLPPPQGGLGEECYPNDTCDAPYSCEEGSCVERPADQGGEGQACYVDFTCDEPFTCVYGICVLDLGGDVPRIDGYWDTRHHLDIREVLPESLSEAGEPPRRIEQFIIDALEWPSWVPAFITEMIDELIEDMTWNHTDPDIDTTIEVLDSLESVMSELRPRGIKAVVQHQARWLALERWESFEFFYLPMCDEEDLSPQPTPPCARLELCVDDLPGGEESLGLDIEPFFGHIQSQDDDEGGLVLVEEREIRFDLERLTAWVADELIRDQTAHDDLESALLESVDCHELSQTVDDWVGDWYSVSGIVDVACVQGVATMTEEVIDSVTGDDFDLGVLRVEGDATSSELDPGGYVHHLGFPEYETDRDGRWDGGFSNADGAVPGGWYAFRPKTSAPRRLRRRQGLAGRVIGRSRVHPRTLCVTSPCRSTSYGGVDAPCHRAPATSRFVAVRLFQV